MNDSKSRAEGPLPSKSTPASTPFPECDAALTALDPEAWSRVRLADRRAILRELTADTYAVAPRWAEACRAAEGLPPSAAGEKWLSGPYLVLRNLRLLEQSLGDLERGQAPRAGGASRERLDGRTVVPVFPASVWDRLFYPGYEAEVWLPPGQSADGSVQAALYREGLRRGGASAKAADAGAAVHAPRGLSLVLGGGNVSSIAPMDVLTEVFAQGRVVVLKMHPVNAYLGPLFEEAFRALIDWNALRIVYGDTDVGAYLAEHDAVDHIHVTGSDRTVEAIAFGTGPEGARRQREGRPKNTTPITSELGNVSPVIVVPGQWSEADLDFQAENLAGMLVNNAGFNCNAVRVIITHREWPQRGALLDRLRAHLDAVPTRPAYYPGAADRHGDFLAAHPDAERRGAGEVAPGHLPWTLIAGLDPDAENEICFEREAFCSVVAETAIAAPTVERFVEAAVDFANERLWGTLNATMIVHPRSLDAPRRAAAVDRAIAELRYGTVAINCWAAVGYGLGTTTWGAFPGHDLQDIQSGTGVVHNTLLFDQPEKSVVRGPFRAPIKPPWFPSHRNVAALAQRIAAFEAQPSPQALPGIFWNALRG